jgi:hypothetical protein
MYSGKPAASIVVTDLVVERGLGKPEGKRRLNEAGQQAVYAVAGDVAGMVDELLKKHWNRTAGAVEETGLPVVQEKNQATCSCGSGIPVQDVVVNGQTITLIALPLIFQQFKEAGKFPSPDTTRELLETVKIYNPIPPGEEEAYTAVLANEYAGFLNSKEATQ